MSLVYALANGPSDYVVAAIAPPQPPPPPGGQIRNKSKMPHVGLINFKDTLPPNGVTLNVLPGSTTLIGALRDENGNIPTGVTVTITKPDGTVINQPTPYTNPDIFAVFSNGTITDLIVNNPAPGNWIVAVDAPNIPPGYEFGFYISTLPIANMQAVFEATLPTIEFDLTHDGNSPNAYLGGSMSCTWCTFGSYAVAAVLITFIAAAAAAGGVITLSTLAAAAGGMAALGLTTQTLVAAFFAGLGTAGGLSIGFVADYICEWTHACPGS